MTTSIPVRALVTGNEEFAVTLGAERIQKCLGKAGAAVTVSCTFFPAADVLENIETPSIVITSLLREIPNWAEPWPEVENRLRGFYRNLTSNPAVVVFAMTIFRHVPWNGDEHAEEIRVRVRRLNRLVADLSREFNVMVIDIDRDFADIGALKLQTDYRLDGLSAHNVASKSIAMALISAGLDEYVPFEIQDAAKPVLAQDNTGLSVLAATDVKPSNILTLGTGRSRQTVKTIVDTNSESHAGWLVTQLLTGRYGLGDAIAKLRQSIARRGLRASALMLAGAFKEALQNKKRSGRPT